MSDELKPSLEEVVAFLCGEKPLHGYWFGDAGEGMGPFWWREELRNAMAMARLATPAPDQSDRERAERVWNEWSITEPLNRRNLYEFLASAFTQIRIEERERCAQVCEGMSQAFTPCADAIRGMK